MQACLKNHNIPFAATDLKADLMAKISASHIKTVYLTDIHVEAEAQGHEVVRLPVGHCELNPIELAWANVKEYIRKHNKQFTCTKSETEMLTPTGIRETSADLWKKYVQHCKEVEDNYGEKDGLIEETVEEFTTQFGTDSDDDDDSDF